MIQKFLNNRWFQIIIFFLALYLIWQTLYTLSVNYYEKRNLEMEYTQSQKEYEQVKSQYNTMNDPANKEKYFREKYHLSKKGEILFNFPKEDS